MFSLPKLLVLALMVGAVWFGFRWWNGRGARAVARDRPDDRSALDMEACSVCGIYQPTGHAMGAAADCGRKNCPYGS